MSKPILTIAIPTYNQSEELNITLKSLLPQIKNLNIEVLIRDDSENNKTEKVVLESDCKQIKYFRGKKYGLDYADMWLMQNASGEYVWWFGDDIFLPNAIDKILKIINMNPDFVWINSVCDEKSKKLGNSRWMSGQEIIFGIGDLLTFLSALLWKRSYIVGDIWLSKKTLGNCMAYMYPQLEALSRGGKYYYCDEPLFEGRKKDFSKLWYEPFTVFTKNYFEALDYFAEKKELKKALIYEKKRRGIEILRGVIYYRLTGKKYGLGLVNNLKIFLIYYKNLYFWKYVIFFLIPKIFMIRLGQIFKIK
jgi:glycosyltransferase involved in cell wall biosynthesis